MADSTRIRLTDERERRFHHLEEATGANTRAGAIDKAARYYVRMAGGTSAIPTGILEELVQTAADRGSLTPEEIAEIVDTRELPVEWEHQWEIGQTSK